MKKTKRFLSLLLVFILLISTVALTSCKKIYRPQNGTNGSGGSDLGGNYIINFEIKDDAMYVTYANDPDNPVNVGSFGLDGKTSSETSLSFIPLPSGTYGVTAGNAKYLEEISIPETYNGKPVTTILDHAFDGAINLKKLTVPDSITNVGDNAFDGCDNLKYTEYENGRYLGSANNPYSIFVDTTSTAIASCKINENTKVIYNDAFSGCKNIMSITLPANVTSIGHRAFSGCTKLTTVNIPEKVFFIGAEAFAKCKALKAISIPTAVESIGISAFYDCWKLETVTFADDCLITAIENKTFGNCKNLKSIKIPKNVVSIGDDKISDAKSGAFSECTTLETVTFAEGSALKQIGNFAFVSCKALKSITLPTTLEKIGTGAFRTCALTEITIPAGVTVIDADVFYNNLKLSKVTLGSATTTIGTKAFAECKALTSVTLPATMGYIAEEAFFQAGLKNVTFADANNWTAIASNETKALSSTDLAASATAATYLIDTYDDYQWVKKTT